MMFHKHIKSLLNSNAMLLKAITYDRMYNLYRASANVVILGVVEAERLNNHHKIYNSYGSILCKEVHFITNGD